MSIIPPTSQPFPKQQKLNSSKLKEFEDYNFIFDENGSSQNHWKLLWGKREIAQSRAIVLFPSVFLKDL